MGAYTPGPADVVPPGETAPEFTAVVRALGVNVAVDVPAEVTGWFGERGAVPVLGLLDGDVGIRATLVPTGGRRHRLYLNADMRRAAGVDVGERVTVMLWRDDQPRATVVPDDLRAALAEASLLDEFEEMAPSHRREYVLWIDDAKRDETRRRRIGRVVEEMRRRR